MVAGRARGRGRPTAASVFELFAAPAARGPPVRRGRRRRPGPRRDRGRSGSTTTSSTPCVSTASSTSRPCDWLADYRFTGDVWGYAEGEVYFPGSPLLVVESTFAEAVVLETLLLSIYNHDSRDRLGRLADDRWPPAAGRASRWARGAPTRRRRSRRPGRRTSRASRPPPTSRPGSGTASRRPAPRALASPCCTTPRRDAFRAQVESLGSGTTLLVDTYDVAEAVRLAVEVAGPELGAVRIDSGDLGVLAAPGARAARRARRHEHPDHRHQRPRRVRHRRRSPPLRSTATASAPQLVTGCGHPTCGFVYKLVARETRRTASMVSVAKKSTDKISIGGRKYALRRRRRRRRGRGRGRRHRRAPRRTTATTGRCWCRWSAPARSSAASRSRRPAATRRAIEELPLDARKLSRATRLRPSTSARIADRVLPAPIHRIAVRYLASRVEP